jgi:hypothetical protein
MVTFQMLTNACKDRASTTVEMFKAVIHVVATHATQKLVLGVNCDSAVLVVYVITTVE